MHIPSSQIDCSTTEQRASCIPGVEEGAKEASSQVTPADPSQGPTAETQSNNNNCKVEPTPVSQEGPETMEVVEEKQDTAPSVKQELSQELLKSASGDICIAEPFNNDLQKLPASSVCVIKTEPADEKQEQSPCQDLQSPTFSLSVDTQESLSAADIEGRLLPHSEEEDEEEEDDDEQMKGEGHSEDIKRRLQEVKPELLLDEMSNMSHGDESSSGFLGSPGEPDPQLSMEFGLVPSSRSHNDNLLTETDDSLPFEPFRSDREKAKRRGSPGRSRVKHVRLQCTS